MKLATASALPMRFLLLFSFCLTAATTFGHVTDESTSIIPAIPSEIRVELKDGRSHSGRPVSFRDEILVVRTQVDLGDVERGFPRDQIARLHFPAEHLTRRAREHLESREWAESLLFLEALWRQRGPFLSLLESETITLLANLPGVHLETGDPYRAIALARNLLPYATASRTANRLDEAILLGHYQLEFFKEAEELARAWIVRQEDFPDSMIGWKILAALAHREENLDQVIWISLQPVALAGPGSVQYLDTCYALAIDAFYQQDERDRATPLYHEMIDRGLAWPDDEALIAAGEFFRTRAETEAAKKAAAAKPDLDLRPPEEDLDLPIQKVRKLLTPSNPQLHPKDSPST